MCASRPALGGTADLVSPPVSLLEGETLLSSAQLHPTHSRHTGEWLKMADRSQRRLMKTAFRRFISGKETVFLYHMYRIDVYNIDDECNVVYKFEK